MSSVTILPRQIQPLRLVLIVVVSGFFVSAIFASPPPVSVKDSKASTEAEMAPYREVIVDTSLTFGMVPIPGGTFMMGSPDSEEDRNPDEGPLHQVKIAPFWMGRCEVTWDVYETFMFELDVLRREVKKIEPTARELLADAVTKPTAPYTDMTFDMGRSGFPAICMTQHAAKMYCEWLTAKTGRYYRLPTEAEWEYACRAASTTAYHFGNDPGELDQYAWFVENTEDENGDYGYRKVGLKKPNAWGLHDMHGNVAEWVLDAHDPDFYKQCVDGLVENPLSPPQELYGRIVRGGSWDDDAELLRSAVRRVSEEDWKQQDPQLPQSIWYHTDALWVGCRVVRPLKEPSDEEKKKYASDKLQTDFDF